MEIKNRATIGLSLIALSGLAVFSWTHSAPVMAQDNDPAKTAPASAPPMKMMEGGSALAASGDYIFALRGGTIYQMKAADLSFVAQKDLPTAPTGKP